MASPATCHVSWRLRHDTTINANDSSHTASLVPRWVFSNHHLMKFTTALQVVITKPHYTKEETEAHRDKVASLDTHGE